MKPIGVYIHIPFCKKKCHYCDFVSYPNKIKWVKKYVDALKKEIEEVGKQNQREIAEGKEEIQIKTIYMGGGTPSYIEARYIQEILNTLRQYFKIKDEIEITIEVNPGTVTKEKLIEYKQAGMNRLSIGLQSTDEKTLQTLGRIHTYKEFEQAYRLGKRSRIFQY